ncbi:MAG: peptidase M50 [Parcubacteria group bacterium Gr01-1014_17]|nr:MAG: peptidase M50 [Parcubacteria group bacterium Gr01-1014_17]
MGQILIGEYGIISFVIMELDIIFSILILIMSVVVHEVSHGAVANYLGDPTARLAGRLSFNPLKHLDFFGSILVPLLLILSKAGIIFGWAKPVPVNPYNLRGKYGEALVSGAGPASNLLIALVFGLCLRFFGSVLPVSFVTISASVVLINILLALFNLVPIPPLDGSKILFAFLPPQSPLVPFLEKYSLFVLLFFIFFLWEFLAPLVGFLFRVFTGIGS